jgi:hypothetical protein
MAQKKIEVVIDGKEFVTTAAKKAEGGVESFATKAKNLLAPLAALGIGAALGGFFKKAIEEALEGEQSMQRMKTAVQNAGTSFEQMRPKIDSTIADLTRLTVYTDDQLMAAFSDMTVQTGDAKGALSNLGLAADLAAAKSIPLETASSAIGKAMEGNTTALQKLIPELKGSSDIMGDLRLKVEGTAVQMGGTFAGSIERAKNMFGEFAQAVGDAILGADGMQGSGNLLVDTLARMATFVSDNREEIGRMVDALLTVSSNIGQALLPAFELLMRVAGPILKVVAGLIVEASFAVRSFAVFTQDMTGKVLQSLGTLAVKGGSILKVFGVTIVSETGASLKKFGEQMESEANSSWGKLTTDHATFWSGIKKAGGESVETSRTQSKQRSAATEEELKKQDAEWKSYLKAVEASYKRINELDAAYLKSLEKLQPALQKAFDKQHIEGTHKALDAAREAADNAFDAIKNKAGPLPPLVQSLGDRVKDMGDELGISARATLDLGQAFGIIDDEAASTLTSVINLAEEIGKIFDAKKGGKSIDFSSMVSIVASAAQILQSVFTKLIFGDDARKKLIEDNTRELSRLRNELGNLSLNVSGEDFGKIQGALGEVLPKLKGGRGAANTTDIVNALAKRGLGMGDLKKLADQLGIKIYSESGALSVDGLRQLFEAMGLVELGKFGQDFGSQKESVTAGFGVNKTDDLGQIGALGQLGANFSGALAGVVDVNDLAGTRARLKGLFERMNAGGLSAAELGGLTGSEFLDLITDIISRIDNLSSSTGGGSTGTGSAGSSGTGGAAGTGGGTVTSGGTVVPTKTLADVLDGVVAQTTALGTYHTEHLSIATAHLNEARTQTAILMDIADNTRGFKSGSVVDLLDTGLEEQRNLEAAERGLGASY